MNEITSLLLLYRYTALQLYYVTVIALPFQLHLHALLVNFNNVILYTEYTLKFDAHQK